MPEWDESEIQEVNESIQNDTLEELAGDIPDIELSVSIGAELTASAGLSVTEVVACACTGLLVMVVLAIIFYLIDKFLFQTYKIRFAIVNLSSNLTLQLSASHYDNVDTNQLLDILGNQSTKTNIFPNINTVNAYNQSTGGIMPDQPVMHLGSFQLGNDNRFLEGLGILLKLI